MSGQTFHIDPISGDAGNDGLSPETPWRTHQGYLFHAGDTVLFKRGSMFRYRLDACSGEPGQPITYGVYGEGENPVFFGSIPVGDPDHWAESAPGIWQYGKSLPSEACNLIFNGGAACGELRWQPSDLKRQGEWHYTRLGLSNDEDGDADASRDVPGILYLCSVMNPGIYYQDIECALYGARRLASGQKHLVFEDLTFRNAGVHGYQQTQAEDVTIRRCRFECIGGAVWSRQRRIRFGNAVEFWDGASGIAVEDCIFHDIYDSGLTHQGGDNSRTPRDIRFTGNLFTGCGMAAYECRGPAAEQVFFERNICADAGGGFAMQGEPPPRRSEIYPEPMGHHVFIWRIDRGTQIAPVHIRHNLFLAAPYGAAIYSQIHPDDEQHFVIDHNVYHPANGQMIMQMNGQRYAAAEFLRYQKETGQDAHSLIMT